MLASRSLTYTGSPRRSPRYASLRRRFWRPLWVVLFRCAAVLLMLFATPGVEKVVVDVAELVTGTSSCDESGCEERPGHACPQSCTHSCCAHPAVLPPRAPELAANYFVKPAVTFADASDRLDLPEHRAPPFRPPAS